MDNILDSTTLRQVQLVQLEILMEFDRICKRNNLTYQLFSGTLLGAIRHEGFIPWDDDVDVTMTRADYDKFLNIYKNEHNPDYFLQNYETDPSFFRQFSRLRKNNTLYLQQWYKDLNIHHGIFIDIFPLDNVKKDSIIEILRYKILMFIGKVNFIKNKGVSNKSNIIKRGIGKVIEFSNLFITKSIFNKIETSIMKYREKHDDIHIAHLTESMDTKAYERCRVKKTDFYDTIEWKFEDYLFPIPRNYDQVLTNQYGDYMTLPPLEDRKPTHGIIDVKFHTTIKRGLE